MSSAAKVGVFMLVILGVLAYFVVKIEDVGFGGPARRKITVLFDSAAGLNEKADVRMAGVPVGKVDRIDYDARTGKAQVTLDVNKDLPLRSNASAQVANLGLLGEKYVELDPGTPNAPPLSADTNVRLKGSQTPSIDDVTSQVSAIATDVKAITASLRNVVAGPQGEQRLQDIVSNVRLITMEVRDLIAANRTNVDATLANAREISAQLKMEIPRLADSIDKVAQNIGGSVGENRQDVRVIVENLRGLSSDLRTTSENLNAITGQVKSGEGTMGKLLYSNEAHDRLTSALTSVESGVNELRNTLARAGRIQLDLGMRADYYAGLNQDLLTKEIGGNSRSEVMLRIVPDPQKNRFYNVVLADDPKGARKDKVFEEIVTDPNTGQSSTTITHAIKYDRDFLISAQAGWNLGPMGVRLGLFDNTGGAGLDYRWNERTRFTGEAFDFGKKRDNRPHLRIQGEYVVRRETPRTPLLFVTSGVDNPLNDTAFTFGGGIRWRDDDLKYLMSSVPIGK